MRAVGYKSPLPINNPESLRDIDLPIPQPTGRNLLIEIRAVSVNPVDVKMRQNSAPQPGEWRVLGWDASGIVSATGPDVKNFKVGDEVFYAGALQRPGTNAEFHLVDERIVGRKPKSLSWSEAAALPLTAITAWEMLFDRLDVSRPVPGTTPSILVIGGAGGVGSIAIQLARALTDLVVIATTSRPETREWALALGAHQVIDHSQPLAAQVKKLDTGSSGFVFSTNQTTSHFSEIIDLLSPEGRFGLIDDPDEINAVTLKRKSLSLHWEFMFTRPQFETASMAEQGRLLNKIADLVDTGKIRTTLSENFGLINADNLKRAHVLLESGKAKGKIVLEGFAK